ncbi:hypothetical protein [Streptomyces sp. 8N706]|uniref:hypothetical protein n=1 Tax=Streptomyces sp. 8N706 TaxID=3457416 RepID=UPI003FD60C68
MRARGRPVKAAHRWRRHQRPGTSLCRARPPTGATTNTARNGFLPAYSCMATDYWPNLRTALLHAAELADAPYTVS